MIKKANYLSAPNFVWWDITYECNLRCRQCYSDSGKKISKIDELSTIEVKQIIKQLQNGSFLYIFSWWRALYERRLS